MASLTSHQQAQGKIELLDLPFETLQLIAWHLDVATFYTWLLTCKRFMHVAKARRIILHHLQNLPGLRKGLERMPTLQLWDLFRRRAAESLCGAGVFADIKSYVSTQFSIQSDSRGSGPGEQPERKYRSNVDPKRYKVSKPVFSLTRPAQVALADDLGIIRVFRLDDPGIRLTSEVHPPSDVFGDSCDVVVLMMAFSIRNDLAVLYQPLEQIKIPNSSPFYQQSRPAPLTIVVYPHRHSGPGDFYYSAEEYEPVQIPRHGETECISMAMARNGSVCLGWLGLNSGDRTHFWLILNDSEESTIDSSSHVIFIRDPSLDTSSLEDPLVFYTSFIKGGQGLNFYEAGNPVHSWFIGSFEETETDHPITWQFSRNSSLIDIRGRVKDFKIEMPFRGSHQAVSPCGGTQFCQYTYHAIGTTKAPSSAIAFILVSGYHVPTSICHHRVHLEATRSHVGWTPVALLAGWRLGGSSLGTVMAVSPAGNRIAAATWDRLLIWTFDGDLLRPGELQRYFPVRDYDATAGLGQLRPTKLSTDSAGVIYDLRWASESRLFANTPAGLVEWDMSISSTGQRQTLSLDQEASTHSDAIA